MSEKQIYSGTSKVRIMEIKNLLDNEGISYHEVDKMDTAYAGIFGEVQLYVSEADAEKAQRLIDSIRK